MDTTRTTSLRKPRIDRCLWIVLLLLILGGRESYAQGVGISEVSITPVGTAILELRSTQRGFLPPRLTTTERDAIVSPATGLLIYNSTTNNLNFYDGTTWTTTSALDQSITPTWTGAHTWSALGTFNLGLNVSGAAVNINASSDFATNINTGTSSGTVSIGSTTGAAGIVERVGTGNYSLDGVAGSTYTVGASTTTGTIAVGGTAQTGAITVGSSSAAQTVNVGTGTGAGTVNIATGATSAKAVNIGTGAVANTILIGNTTAGTRTGVNVAATTAQLHLGAGTATASQGAPLKLTSGTNLTTAEAGAVEYDGKVFYNTAVASTRQVTTTQQFISNTADFTMANVATPQSVFAAANDVITVDASTSYFFEATYYITGMGATTRTTATLFGGTATFTSIRYFAMIQTGAANALGTAQSTKSCITATANVLNVTTATAAAVITLKGIMRINAAGTIIPQIQFSANPTGTILGTTDSWFRMWPIGTNTVAAVGNVN